MSAESSEQPGPLFAWARRRDFDGETYRPPRDGPRMGSQLAAVFEILKDGAWHKTTEFTAIGFTAGITARIRDFRKDKFGGWRVESRPDPDAPRSGIWEYRLLPREEPCPSHAPSSTPAPSTPASARLPS